MSKGLSLATLSKAEHLECELRDSKFDHETAVKECDRLKTENNSLRNALAARNAQYWELHEAVTRLYKTIEGEKLIAASIETA